MGRGMEEEGNKMQRILNMKGGLGEESYANNSKSQRAYLSSTVPVLVQATLDFCDTFSTERVNIADMGCSSGPNTLFAVNEMIGIIHKRFLEMGRSAPEFCVFLNDLPGNDFNTVFQSLPAFHEKMRTEQGPDLGPCYISAVPGSFYSRLFPPNSLHLVHCSSSLHWLSQVPPELNDRSNPAINKGKVFVSKTSPPAVISAYRTQFQRDFSSFLKARSIEVVPGGRMVLMFKARRVEDPTPDESCLLWDYLGQAFQELVSQGLIEEEKLDSYDTPYYEPYTEDIKDEIEKEGSFTVDVLVTIILPWDGCNGGMGCDRRTTAENMGKAMRAVNGSMIGSCFGEQILDPLFQKFSEIMAADQKEVEHVSVVVSVIRNIGS